MNFDKKEKDTPESIFSFEKFYEIVKQQRKHEEKLKLID